MIQGLLGKKIGMSRWFDADGNSVPVTVIKCGPCYVVASSGSKVRIGFEEVKEKKLSKPEAGFLKKLNLPFLKYIREVEWAGKEEDIPKIGTQLGSDIFEVGDNIDISGNSKGKGFTGVVKRWGFKGGPGGHGSNFHRAPGSIGQGSDPSRVFPGLKMAGRKGGKKITQMNQQIVNIDKNENFLMVKGSVPGPNGSLVFVRRTIKSGK